MSTASIVLPQQARSKDKLARLLEAGRTLFAERGFDGTRIADVVAAAGCSVGVFYQRFADKDALFAAVQDAFLADVATAATARRAPLGAGTSLRDLLRVHVEQAVTVFRTNAGLLRAFLHYELAHPGFDAPLRVMTDAATAAVAGALSSAGIDLDHRDPATALSLGVRVVRGVLVDELLHGRADEVADDDRLVDELTSMLAAYLGDA